MDWLMRLKILPRISLIIKARMMGAGKPNIKLSRARTMVFLISGALLAVASCLSAYDIGVEPGNGFKMLTYAMVAMIVGGTGRYWTCLLGGITLGFLQGVMGSTKLSAGWNEGVIFLLLLLFLFLRPQGLAGHKQRTV